MKEASSGEPLIGAVVFTEDLSAGVSTNNYGFYSLQVDRKAQVIKCSYAGYVTAEVTIDPKGPVKYDFALEEDREVLEAAKVFSKSKREQLTLPQLGKDMGQGEVPHLGVAELQFSGQVQRVGPRRLRRITS